MKKIRKIIALALATVMMMAMSITAFAEETVTLTVDVSGISTRESSTIKVYQLATIDKENNKIQVCDWATGYYSENKTAADAVKDIDAILNDNDTTNDPEVLVEKESKGENTVTLTSEKLIGGIYYITMSGETVKYSSMIAQAYEVNSNGVYVAKNATVIAKGTSNTVDKVANDDLVYAGQTISFAITSTVPYNKDSYVVYDKVENLTINNDVKAYLGGTLGKDDNGNYVVTNGTEITGAAFVADTNHDNQFNMDLSALVNVVNNKNEKTNENAGKNVYIIYTAVVNGANGYVNSAYDSTHGSYDTPATVVKGFEADITLTKLASDKNSDGSDKKLSGAEFQVTKVTLNEDGTIKDSSEVYKFKDLGNGVYKLAEAGDKEEELTDTIVTVDGKVQITGIDEGTYHFEETKAPTGYSINKEGKNVTVVRPESLKEEVSVSDSIVDSILSTLPFTGGMGTTIFTVLGVAIMVLAATLYFVSKRKAAK